jgi:methanogenic corrinoid protein MtbC1
VSAEESVPLADEFLFEDPVSGQLRTPLVSIQVDPSSHTRRGGWDGTEAEVDEAEDADDFYDDPDPLGPLDPQAIGSELLGLVRDTGIGRGSAGGGRVVALPYGTPQSRGLARAAMTLDTYEVTRLIRDALRRDGTVSTWTSMVMPVLRALGDRTQTNGDVIEVEHAFSEAVLGALRSVLLDSPHQGRNTSTVLLACADGDYHSLPLHALAAALAERKVSCRLLGSGLPPEALSASVRRTGPSVVVLFARMPGADASPTQVLRRQRPAPTVVLAGPGWRPETIPAFARSAASLDEAIHEVLLGVHL